MVHLASTVPVLQNSDLYIFFDFFSTWEEGKMIIIDDSIEHEVWHDGTTFRMILIVDFWHPDLTKSQRDRLTPI